MRLFLSISFLLLVVSWRANAQTVNYSEHIAPILYKHCTPCHRPGEIAPFSLTSYDEAKGWGPMLQYVTGSKYMPPWKPDHNYSSFLGENYLSDDQILLVRDWVQGGMIQGDPAKEPPVPVFPTGSQVGVPDLVLSFSRSYKHIGADDYRIMVLPTGLTQDRDLACLEMRPGNSKIVHHALFSFDTTGQAKAKDGQDGQIGFPNFGAFGIDGQYPGYVPGQKPRYYPDGFGQKMYKNSDLLIQMHYAPTTVEEYDSSTVNIFFAKKPVTRYIYNYIMLPTELVDGPFVIPANKVKKFHGEFKVPYDVSLLGISPHMHLLGQDWEVYYVTPQKDTVHLVKIDDWDFNWQGTYHFKKLLKVPKGSTIYANATYDNTVDNPLNPNTPPKLVTWGEKTTDEMYYLPFTYVLYRAGDENIEFTELVATNEVTPEGTSSSRLLPVYPNPASGNMTVGFVLERSAKLNIRIFDINGKPVKTIANQRMFDTGFHNLEVDLADAPSGVYYVTLEDKGFRSVQKICLIK